MKKHLLIAFIALSGCALRTGTGASQTPAFQTPEAAVESLASAIGQSNLDKIKNLFGPAADEVISSGDPVADKNSRQKFAEMFNQRHRLEAADENRYALLVGESDWPFPVPIVKSGAGWSFDTEAGKEELLNRRIGSNEISAIDMLNEYVDAQREYYSIDRDGDGVREYAQKVMSSRGEHDGLFWPRSPGEPPSPIGPLVAQAEMQGYSVEQTKDAGEPRPFNGYYFKILTAQSAAARGGAKIFLNGKNMTGGFGMEAYPARYGSSGVMTFIVNQDGQILQSDLGSKTAEASKNATFDPTPAFVPAVE